MSDDTDRAELAAEKKAVRHGRWAFLRSPLSAFVKTMQEAMRQYLAAREQGVSREDGIRGIKEELRGAWPKSVSKFTPTCHDCDDTGWRELVCWERQRCGREVCAKNPERQHAYVVPCDCERGDRKRKRTITTDDQLAAVGKTQPKKRGFTRLGT